MKKLTRIISILAILSITGCDFLRQVAGRPTEKEIELKKAFIDRRDKAIADSIKLVREKAREQVRLIEVARQDSIRGNEAVRQMGIRVCREFSYGKPVDDSARKYNVVIGVFRQNLTAAEAMTRAIKGGYYPYAIRFRNDIKTVCLCGGDSLGAVMDTVAAAKSAGYCPEDAWLYVVSE